MIHTVKGFSTVNKIEVDVLLEFPCLLYDPTNVGNLISDFYSFSKPSLDIWKFSVHIMLKPSMQDFKHDLTSMWDGCSCVIDSIFFGTTLLGNWRRKWQPTRVFLPGKSYGWRMLIVYSPWGHKELTQMSCFIFSLFFLGIGMRIDFFQSCGHCWVFQICWHNECKTLMASSFRDLSNSAGISLSY